jgi:hypothetical protein
VLVSLFIRSSSGCADSIIKYITVPGNTSLLPQGIIVLYKKATSGFFMLADANIISNGLFSFEQLSTGKYMIYAMPHIYYTDKYLPTYYVNKLHWADAQIINLNSNAYGLTLQMVSVNSLETGPCKIIGKVVYTGTAQAEQTALKSATSVSYPVILYTGSGAVITSVTPDESGNFTFENLPYGNYIVRIEYPNITSDDLTVNLSPESPEASNLEFVIDASAMSVSSLSKETDMIVYNVSAGQIAVRLSKGGKYNVSIIDITGRTLLMNSQTNFEPNIDKTITIGAIPKGMYILKLQNNANTIIRKFEITE